VAKARKKQPFDVQVFLNTMDGGRTVSAYRKNRKVFSKGDAADSVFYIQEGQVKLYVVSELGKEAVVALHGKGDFFGEGCLTGQPLRLATAAAMTGCVILRVDLPSSGCSMTSRSPPKCSCLTSWLGMRGWEKIWSTSFSIRARSAWPDSFS
jgi:hypothetical protein